MQQPDPAVFLESEENGPDYFKHEKALVESSTIGTGTRIWAFSHILPQAKIGKECNICDHVFIENDVVVGNRVTIKCGVQLWDGVAIEDDVFIGPNATFTNDIFPRSKQYPEKFLPTLIRKNASIGANATILAGITIHNHAMVGAGAVVIKDVPPYAIVVGNPARIIGYTNTPKQISNTSSDQENPENPVALPGQARLIDLPLIKDLRGLLSFGEVNKHLPFTPLRYFLVFDVPSGEVRGEHAHKRLHQFLICVKGSCSVTLDDGQTAKEIKLSSPSQGLHIPPRVWSVQYKYTADALLLVLASDTYQSDDYLRSYDEFLQFIHSSLVTST
jgi:UDP-2-acetamido-3-amino-2,3-dideoxy-glucuronate N-acetyltransferase